MAFWAWVAVSQAATLQVGSSAKYTTITDALDDASSGDTIEIDAGTYSESLEIDFDVTLTGAGSSTVTVTDSGEVLEITDSAVVIVSGMTLGSTGKRTVDIDGATVSFSDVVFAGADTAEDGAGARVNDATVSFDDCVFTDNVADDKSGGHLYIDASDVTVSDSAFDAGLAKNGGAIYAKGATTLVISDTTFETHEATGDGGTVYATGIDLTVESCFFTDGTSGDDGAHLYIKDATAAISGSDLSTGVGDDGGALFSDGAEVSVEETTFEANSTADDGGALVAKGGTLTLTSVTLDGNDAGGSGGAVYAYEDAVVSLDDVEATDNVADVLGGAVGHESTGALTVSGSAFEDNAAEQGGAVAWLPDDTTASMEVASSTFTENLATDGGAIYAEAAGTLGMDGVHFTSNVATTGGAVALVTVEGLEVEGALFCANAADDGAAVSAVEVGAGGTHRWNESIFAENEASGYGGGLYVQGQAATVLDSDFLANTAGTGGGLYVVDGDLELTNSIIVYTTSGDGAYAESSSTATWTWSLGYNDFYDNTSDDVGGDLSALDSTNLTVDPDFVDYSPDGDCTNDDLRLSSGSDLIDAGDPSITDPDGSVSDIGVEGPDTADVDTGETETETDPDTGLADTSDTADTGSPETDTADPSHTEASDTEGPSDTALRGPTTTSSGPNCRNTDSQTPYSEGNQTITPHRGCAKRDRTTPRPHTALDSARNIE